MIVKPQWEAVDPQPHYSEHIAPPGTIHVCGACGKTARDKYGMERGWDESCMLNAVLCKEQPND
jgi:hypothetical protein